MHGEIKMSVACPDCDADVVVADNDEVDDLISCDECGSELVITSLNPVTVDLAGEEEYDDDEEDDY